MPVLGSGQNQRTTGSVIRYGGVQPYPCPIQLRSLIVPQLAEAPSDQVVTTANTTVEYQGYGVYRITKSGGFNGTPDANVTSAALTGDFVLRVRFLDTASAIDFGVSAVPAVNPYYANIDRSLHSNPGDAVYAYEDGVSAGGFALLSAATFYFMRRVGSTITVLSGPSPNVADATIFDTLTDLGGTVYLDIGLLTTGATADVLLYQLQSLASGLFTNSSSFFSPAVTASYSLVSALFSNSQTLYAAAVVPGPVGLAPSLSINSQSFFAPTVVPGAVTVSPPLFTDADAFFSPTITAQPSGLLPSLFTNAQTFYAPAITTIYRLLPGLDGSNAQIFFGPTVVSVRRVSPGLLTNVPRFFRPRIVATQWHDEAEPSGAWTDEPSSGTWTNEPANDATWTSEAEATGTWTNDARPTGNWS